MILENDITLYVEPRKQNILFRISDSMGTDDVVPTTEDDAEVIDDEVDTAVELQMRKMRYEQLKFQEEKGVRSTNIL